MDLSKIKSLYRDSVYDDLFLFYKMIFWRFRVEWTKYTPTLYSKYLIWSIILFWYMVYSWEFNTIDLTQIGILLILQPQLIFLFLCIIIPKVVSSIKYTSILVAIPYVFELAQNHWIYTHYKFERLNTLSLLIIVWSISFHYRSWKDFYIKKAKTDELLWLLIESAGAWIIPYILIMQILY